MPFLNFLPRFRTRNPLAFVFYATDEDYAVAAMVFVHLLRLLGMRRDADVVLLHLPLPPPTLERLKRMGITTRLVEKVQTLNYWGFRHCLVKLRLLELAEYERVVYADADSIPLKSLDDLLSLATDKPLAAPRAYWLPVPQWTSALLVARPAPALWNRASRHFAAAAWKDYFDMEIINREFAGEIESLPPQIFRLNSEWEGGLRFLSDVVQGYAETSVVHFTALGKPWMYTTAEARQLRPHAHPIFYDLWDRWRTTRDVVMR